MKHCVLIFHFILITAGVCAQNASFTRGVYKTFEEFKAGSPTVVDSFYVDSLPRLKKKWVGTYHLTPRYVKNRRSIKKIWGFCDGTNSYISFQAEYFPIVFSGSEISFEAYGIFNTSGIVASGVLFGAIGVGIYSLAASEAAKSERVWYRINPLNGDVLSAEQMDLVGSTVKERKLILYRATKKEIKEPMAFSVNERVIENFVPGSYLEMEFQPGVNEVNVCFGSNLENCETILFTELVQYVECMYINRNSENEYEFKMVDQSTGEHNSAWSFDVQERREKRIKR